jgi:hypothetical protein
MFSVSQLKWIAVISMVIDHIGVFFFPHLIFLRIIGRLAFPIFAWLIANGAYHTSNINKYIGRIFILAVLTQVPFAIANGISPLSFYFNAVFTLGFGLIAIYIIKHCQKNILLSIFSVLLITAFARIINSDYGAFGVLMIIAFYIFYEKKILTLISQAIIFLIPTVLYFYGNNSPDILQQLFFASSTEFVGFISVILIVFRDKKTSPGWKWFFYIFYPMQYIFISIVQMLFLSPK